jgi:hypothetical protein
MRLIPSQIAPATRSRAEKRLFAAFKALGLPDNYCCLHSVNLPDHEYKVCGELDFVLIGPGGLYVLEVKGGGVSCKEGIWYFENRYGQIEHSSEGPFQQARSGMYSLRTRLLDTFSEYELSQLVFGYGVVFPDCDFDVAGIEWPREIILDTKRWHNEGLSAYIKTLEKYWHTKLARTQEHAPGDLIARLIRALRPSFDLVRSLQSQADEIEGRLVQLTEEQYSRLDIIEESRCILIQGGAGTGKTFLAIEIARRHAASGQQVLFVCFSPVLAAYIAAQNTAYRIRVASVYELMLDVVSKYGQIPSGYIPGLHLTDPWFVKYLAPAYDAAARHLPKAEQFDVLIVDEGQDILNIDHLSALGSMLKGGLETGTWRIFYDPFNQGAIFNAMDPDALELLDDYQPVKAKLKINCRNTDQIVWQTKLITGADIGTRSTGPGPEVIFKTFHNTQEAAGLLEAYLDNLWNRQVEGYAITILSPVPFQQSSAFLLSKKWHQRITVLSSLGRLKFPFRGLTFATVAEFKGLENRFIALIDIEDLDSTPSALAALYVGMSRARVSLWVAMHEQLRDRQRELGKLHLPQVLEDMQHGR